MLNSKTYIISCAGRGQRLGIGTTKALIDISGKPLIIRTLEMLDECEDVRVVVGFQAEKVIQVVNEYREDVTFVFNHDYINNGTGASVSLAAKNANDYVITIDGDLLIHPEDMELIIAQNKEFVGVFTISSDDPVYAQADHEMISGFSRQSGDYEWSGVSQIKNSKLKNGDGHVFQLLEPLLPLEYLKIRAKEVDTMNDYENAIRWYKNSYKD